MTLASTVRMALFVVALLATAVLVQCMVCIQSQNTSQVWMSLAAALHSCGVIYHIIMVILSCWLYRQQLWQIFSILGYCIDRRALMMIVMVAMVEATLLAIAIVERAHWETYVVLRASCILHPVPGSRVSCSVAPKMTIFDHISLDM